MLVKMYTFLFRTGIILVVFGLAIGIASIFFDIMKLKYVIATVVLGLLLLLVWLLFPSLFSSSKNGNENSTDTLIDNIREFLTENEVKPVIRENLLGIISGISSMQKNCDIIDSLLKERFNSYSSYTKYIIPIRALEKEINIKISYTLKNVQFYGDSIKASSGRETVKLKEFELNCTKALEQRLDMLNYQTDKIENLRNKLADKPDDTTWLNILENEIEDLTKNILLYE